MNRRGTLELFRKPPRCLLNPCRRDLEQKLPRPGIVSSMVADVKWEFAVG
jgi:hypothetical protein